MLSQIVFATTYVRNAEEQLGIEVTMRAQDDVAEKRKNPTSMPKKRGFGSFGAILISVIPALLCTVAVTVKYNVYWAWWLPMFSGFGLAITAGIHVFLYLRQK